MRAYTGMSYMQTSEAKMRLLVFGDSNTYGFDGENCGRFPKQERFPGVLQALIGDGAEVFEAGLPGRTADFEDPIAVGMRGTDVIERVMRHYAPLDVLAVMLGVNDIKERFNATAAMAAEGVGTLADIAESLPVWKGRPRIIVIAPPTVGEDYEKLGMALELGRGCRERSLELPAALESMAAERGYEFFDASRLGMALSRADGIHMTRGDHKKLAAALAEYLNNN